MRSEAEGTTYPPVVFAVDPDRVRTFAQVFGAGPGVPPTFVTAAEFTILPRVIQDPTLGLDFSRVIHSTQEYIYERPLRIGEALEARARIESVKVRAGTGFLTVVTELREPAGHLVATARSTFIERAAGS